MPEVVQVHLTGALPDGVMAMDVILKLLSIGGGWLAGDARERGAQYAGRVNSTTPRWSREAIS